MKKTYLHRIMAVGLVAAMAVGLAGCGKKIKTSTEDPKNAKEYVYSYSNLDISIPGDNTFDISTIESSGDTTFAIANTYDYETGNNLNYLVDIQTESNTANAVLLETPDFSDFSADITANDGFYEYSYYGNFSALSGVIVGTCTYNCSSYDDAGNYQGVEKNLICGWNTSGKFLWSIDTNKEFKAEYIYLSNGFAANDTYYTIVSGNTDSGKEIKALLAIDKNGKLAGRTEIAGTTNISSVYALKNGKFLAFYYDNEYNQKAAYFDINNGSIGDEVVVPNALYASGYTCIKPGFDSDFVYSNAQGIFKFSLGDTDVVKIMDPINSDLNGYNVNNFVFVDKDHFIGSYSNLETYSSEIAMFTYVDPATIPDKKIISMAVYYLASDVRKRVIDFNKTSDSYRIVVEDYSQYATPDDWEAGFTKLNNDILAGKVPSILFIAPYSGIDYESFAKKGLLADVDTLIKKDEELSQYTYLENVFDAFAVNGKHYMVIPSFNYNTYMTSKKNVGDKTSLTVDEFSELIKNSVGSKPYEYCTQSTFLNLVMTYDGYEFIDPTTKKCRFDSPEFVKFVEYAASLPAEDSYDDDFYTDYYDNFRSNRVLFSDCYLSDINNYQYQRYNMYDGEGVLIGFPTTEGQPGIINNSGNTFAVTNSSNIDGAWEFARYYLTPEYQESQEYTIPVLESSFDKWIAKGMEKPYWEDENGIKNYYDNTYYVDGVEKVIPVMTQEDVDYLKKVITSCTKSGYNNEQIMSIIEEECSACFAGQKSATEVCNIIQSRAQLYINENN